MTRGTIMHRANLGAHCDDVECSTTTREHEIEPHVETTSVAQQGSYHAHLYQVNYGERSEEVGDTPVRQCISHVPSHAHHLQTVPELACSAFKRYELLRKMLFCLLESVSFSGSCPKCCMLGFGGTCRDLSVFFVLRLRGVHRS